MKRKITAAILSAMLTISLTACMVSGAAGTDTDSKSTTTSSVTSASSATASATAASAASADAETVSVSTKTGTSAATSESSSVSEAAASDEQFKDKDIDTSYSDEVTITLKDNASTADGSGVTIEGNTITITASGTYLLTGTLTDGQIIIDADSEETVHLILDNVSISNSSSAAIYSLTTDKLIITLAEDSENELLTTGEYVQTDDNEVDAAIFSKTDLSLNGEGALTVTSAYGHGIVSKDDLVITSGTYEISAAKCALSGKDSIRIAGGIFDLEAGTDALHSDNTEDEGKGYIYIIGGTFNISCDDDAVHTSGDLTVRDGTFNIENSYEGLEGLTINIEGGTFDINSSDDAVNAAGGNDGSGYGEGGGEMFAVNTDAYVKISGGDIVINSGGDSLDSNGSLYISGGTIVISGPEEAMNGTMDYNGEGVISGGTLISAGSSGMAMNFGSTSTQCSILQNLSSAHAAGETITLKDSDGSVILEMTAEKQFSSVLLSSPELETGSTYTLTVGDETYSIELTETIYGSGSGMGMGGMQGGMMGGPGMNGGNGGFGR